VYALREQLINAASNPKLKLDTIEVMAKTIKTFNDFVMNRKRKTVMWRKDEDFPRVI
jgi:5-methylthioribose kinase